MRRTIPQPLDFRRCERRQRSIEKCFHPRVLIVAQKIVSPDQPVEIGELVGRQ